VKVTHNLPFFMRRKISASGYRGELDSPRLELGSREEEVFWFRIDSIGDCGRMLQEKKTLSAGMAKALLELQVS